jgi:hypothetical protein
MLSLARAFFSAAEADPLAILRDENEADSDEEWKGIKERAAARQVAKAAAAPQQQQPQQARQQQRKQAGAAGGGGEELPGEDHAELSDKVRRCPLTCLPADLPAALAACAQWLLLSE